MMITKLVSGGQTGADIAALDVALRHDFPHGGWCPKGRKSLEGPIPAKYQLTETPSASYSPTDPASRPATALRIHQAVEIEVVTELGTNYRIQCSTDTETWTDTDLVIEGTGGAVREIFWQTTSGPRKFWRAREE